MLLGAHSKSKFTGTEKFVKIQKWITHPNAIDFQNDKPYGEWQQNVVHWDYTLLLLAKEVEFTKYIKPIALPTEPDQEYITNTPMAFVSGWGNTRMLRTFLNELDDDKSSDIPKRVTVKVVPHDEQICRKRGFYALCSHCAHEAIICTYGRDKFNSTLQEDACRGDSGGSCLIFIDYVR